MLLAQLRLQKKLIIIAEPQELTQTSLSSVTVVDPQVLINNENNRNESLQVFSHLAMHVGLYVNNDILVR